MKSPIKIQNLVLICLSFILPLIAPYIDFLRFNHYGYFRSDALVLASLLMVIGIGLGILFKVGNWLVKLLVFAFLATLSISYFPEVQSIGALLCVFFGSAFIFMLLSQYAIELLLIFFGVLALGNLFLPMKIQLYSPSIQTHETHQPLANLPPIIYLILDEQEGIDGFPQDLPHVSEFKTKFAGFFKANGFKVYDAAFSHYPATYNSIPNALNFTTSNVDDYYFYGKKERDLTQNLLLNLLAKKGYQIRIYQSDFINYCAITGLNISYCYTYPAQSLSLIQNIDLPLSERLRFLVKSFFMQSSLLQHALYFYRFYLEQILTELGWHIMQWQWSQDSISSVLQPQILEKIQSDILQEPQGKVFFAHLLFPHDPFLYDADCHLRLEPDTWNIQYEPTAQYNSVQSRESHYAYYLEQDECAQQRLNVFFQALRQAGIYQNAIIIIHGDHGSRIALDWLNKPANKENFTRQDFKDYFQTLYVSKLPAQASGYDDSALDLQTLLAHDLHIITGEKIKSSKDFLYVYLYSQKLGKTLVRTSISDFK